MTKEIFDNIATVLKENYDFDGLDILEFVLHYERISGERIPDEWTKNL